MKIRNFIQIRKNIRQDIMNSFKLAQTKMSIKYDAKHKFSNFKKKVFLKLIKLKKSKYHVFNYFFLFSKKIDSFQIVRKISSLTYEFNLSSSMNVHFVISMIHLKQANENQYNQNISKISKVLKENEKKIFVVKKIIKQKNKRNREISREMKRIREFNMRINEDNKSRRIKISQSL